jgi:hypothetical protein
MHKQNAGGVNGRANPYPKKRASPTDSIEDKLKLIAEQHPADFSFSVKAELCVFEAHQRVSNRAYWAGLCIPTAVTACASWTNFRRQLIKHLYVADSEPGGVRTKQRTKSLGYFRYMKDSSLRGQKKIEWGAKPDMKSSELEQNVKGVLSRRVHLQKAKKHVRIEEVIKTCCSDPHMALVIKRLVDGFVVGKQRLEAARQQLQLVRELGKMPTAHAGEDEAGHVEEIEDAGVKEEDESESVDLTTWAMMMSVSASAVNTAAPLGIARSTNTHSVYDGSRIRGTRVFSELPPLPPVLGAATAATAASIQQECSSTTSCKRQKIASYM